MLSCQPTVMHTTDTTTEVRNNYVSDLNHTRTHHEQHTAKMHFECSFTSRNPLHMNHFSPNLLQNERKVIPDISLGVQDARSTQRLPITLTSTKKITTHFVALNASPSTPRIHGLSENVHLTSTSPRQSNGFPNLIPSLNVILFGEYCVRPARFLSNYRHP